VNVSLRLPDPQHNVFVPVYTFDNIALGADSLLLPDAEDFLCNLGGRTVDGFHLEITMVSGSAGFTGALFNWGASEIAGIPEPSALTLVALGGGLVVVCCRRRSCR